MPKIHFFFSLWGLSLGKLSLLCNLSLWLIVDIVNKREELIWYGINLYDMVNIGDSDDPLLFYLKFSKKIILEFDLKLSIHLFAYVFCFIQQGEAKKALQMLRKPAVPIDLQVQIKFRIWNIEPLGLYPSLQRTGCQFFLFCFFIVLNSPVIYLHLYHIS